MNYTDKYHLPQWEETDRIMHTDFNQMCADMEAGLDKTARDAAADTAEARNVNGAAAAKAQATADTAVRKADAAREVADAAYCPSFKSYVIGTYTGNAYTAQEITLGFKPSFVAVIDMGYGAGRLVGSGEGIGTYVVCTANGFRVSNPVVDPSQSIAALPNMNKRDAKFAYIAFR